MPSLSSYCFCLFRYYCYNYYYIYFYNCYCCCYFGAVIVVVVVLMTVVAVVGGIGIVLRKRQCARCPCIYTTSRNVHRSAPPPPPSQHPSVCAQLSGLCAVWITTSPVSVGVSELCPRLLRIKSRRLTQWDQWRRDFFAEPPLFLICPWK